MCKFIEITPSFTQKKTIYNSQYIIGFCDYKNEEKKEIKTRIKILDGTKTVEFTILESCEYLKRILNE